MDDRDRTWSPILGLVLSASLGFLAVTHLGLPALCLGFVLLRLQSPLPWSRRGRLLFRFHRTSGWMLGLGFFLGATGALEQADRWPAPSGASGGSALVHFEGRLQEEGRAAGFGRSEARLRAGGESLILSTDHGDLHKGSWIEGSARLDRQPGLSYLHTQASLYRIDRSAWEEMRNRLRKCLDGALRQHLSPDVARLVHRLLLGRDEDLPARIERAHRRLGLSHLLAISGMHTLFLAGFLRWLLRPIFHVCGGELRLLVPLLLGYAWLTGGQAPVLRAVLAYLFWRLCWVRGWPFDIGACLGVAALFVLALFPADFASLSFLLSYSATVALVCFFRPLQTRLQGLRLGSTAATLLAASIAAQVGTAALSLQGFGHLSPWGILATPLLLPLLFASLALGLLFFLSLPIPYVPVAISWLLDPLGRSWLALVQAPPPLPAAPLHPLYLPPVDLTLSLLLIGGLVALVLHSRRLLLLAFLLPLLPWFLPLRASPRWGFTLLPIGHGMSSLLDIESRVILFDCGDLREGRRATRAILAALRERGPARIQDLVLSHADQDHASALPELLLRLRIDRIWLPESPKAARIQRLLRTEPCEVHVLPPGSSVWISADTMLLSPHTSGDLAGSNDGGLVLYHGFAHGPDLLITGDQEEAGTAALLRCERLPDRIDLLVLPHHGSAGSHFDRLVRRFAPRYCLASTGSRRRIDPGILDAVAPGLPLLTTGRSGAIHVHRDAFGTWRIATERGMDIQLR